MKKPQTQTTNQTSQWGTQPRDLRNDSSGTRRLKPEPWSFIRERIWRRDSATCQVCGARLQGVHFTKGWRCGHLIDRVAGGSDEDNNLAVMCIGCDRIKPQHWSLDEYEQWRQGRMP